jgi:hypothetical protein
MFYLASSSLAWNLSQIIEPFVSVFVLLLPAPFSHRDLGLGLGYNKIFQWGWLLY